MAAREDRPSGQPQTTDLLADPCTHVDDVASSLAATSLAEPTGAAPVSITMPSLLTAPSTASTASASAPPTAFHRFPDLPTELRLKIWHFSFAPRVVEVHRRKSHYADGCGSSDIRDSISDGGGSSSKLGNCAGKWQSWSSNPAALAVSYEARACALQHYTATIRLAVNTPCERAGEARLDLHRRLYLAPHADTLAMLGEFNVAQTVELLRHIEREVARRTNGRRTNGRREGSRHRLGDDTSARPRAAETHAKPAGLRRLAVCASSIGQRGSGILLLIYSRTIFQDLEQLVLFMYPQRMPPEGWRDGHCELVDCHDTYQYRRFLAGQGAELKDKRVRGGDIDGGRDEGRDGKEGWMTVGQRPLEVLDIVFGREESGRVQSDELSTMHKTTAAARTASTMSSTMSSTLSSTLSSTMTTTWLAHKSMSRARSTEGTFNDTFAEKQLSPLSGDGTTSKTTSWIALSR